MSSQYHGAHALRAGVGVFAAASTLAAGLLLAPSAFSAEATAPTLDDYKAGPTLVDLNFNDVSNGATGAITSGKTTATIHGAAAIADGNDGTQAARISNNFWLDVKNTDGSAVLKGKHAITISYDANPDTKANGNLGWSLFAASNSNAQKYQFEHYIGFLDTEGHVYFERYNNSGARNDMGAAKDGVHSGWKHVDVTVTDEATSLYIDGQLVNRRAPIDDTHQLTKILGESGGILQVGRANWGNGEYFKGIIDNIKIVDSTEAAVRDAIATMNIPQTATEDFTVLTSSNGKPVTWQSNNTAITIGEDGVAKVTRPAVGQKDAVVTLTAASGDLSRTYTVNVPHIPSDAEDAKADLDAITLYEPNDVRSNLVLPATGEQGSTITWSVKKPGSVAHATVADGFDADTKSVVVDRPAAGSQADTVVLTATVQHGDTTLTKDYTLTIAPLPSEQSESEAYIWAFFTGEGVGGEKISLAASKGNNALDWNTLNGGTPMFTSTLGEQGLRDPFIMKSHNGDKFYMLATDLKISGRTGSFNGAQRNGSKYIEIWESNDLVNWSNERHVKVSSDYAGNTWAPEAYWDDELGEYVVYWASNLYDTEDNSLSVRTKPTYNRMMYATTKDFITFSEPKTWIDVDRRGGDGSGSIDVTVQKQGDTYYRVYKDEKVMKLRQEKSKDLVASIGGAGIKDYATALQDSAWSEVAVNIGDGQPNGYGGVFSAGEGPSLFPANKGDVNGYQYYLFVDQPNYHGGPNHYVPMATNDITRADAWQVIGDAMPESQMPLNTDGGRPRHGTVLGVTRAQYQQVLKAYEPAIAVQSVDAMDVSTELQVAPQLPKQAHLTFADGHAQNVDVEWQPIQSQLLTQPGEFTVQGTAQDKSRMPVEVTVHVGQHSEVATVDGPHAQVAEGGTVVFARPQSVQALSQATIMSSPQAGSIELTSDGVQYTAEQTTAGNTYTSTVRYTDGQHSVDVVYSVEVVSNIADASHDRVASHDPSIVKDGDTYYIFGSHRSWAKSTDLVHWQPFTNNLSSDYKQILAPAWNSWSGKNTNNNPNIGGNMWAPDVFYNKTMGKWCMYLSLNGGGFPYQQSMIVLLTADSPSGDWTYVGPVVYSGFSKDNVEQTDVLRVLGNNADLSRYASLSDSGINAIDPDINQADDGTLWMSYGSWFGGIYMLKLDPNTGLRDYGTTYSTQADVSDAYYGTKIAGGHWNSGEGASYARVGDWWYLFVSYGNLGVDGGYQIREFRSKNLTGPYVDPNGNSAIWTTQEHNNTNGENKYANRGLRVMATVDQPGNAELRTAQGGNSMLVDEDGAIYNVYHTRFVDRSAKQTATGVDHEVRVQQMMVSPDGWLVSTPYEYSGDFLDASKVNANVLAGTWQFSVLDPTHAYAGKGADDLGIYHSVSVALQTDGTISGQAQGTWEIKKHALALHITASAPGSLLSGDYILSIGAQPNETGGYALILSGVGGDTFTYAGEDIAQPTAGKAGIWAVRQIARSTAQLSDHHANNPETTDNDADNSGDCHTTPTNLDAQQHDDALSVPTLAATGSAIVALVVLTIILVVSAGVSYIHSRKGDIAEQSE